MPKARSLAFWKNFYEEKSLILHPEKRFDDYGRPTSSESFNFDTIEEYLKKLLSKKTDEWGNPLGLLEQVKWDLKEANDRWAYRCKARNESINTKPSGDHLDEINRLTAKKTVLEAEARNLNKWLSEKEKSEADIFRKKQKLMAHKGNCKLRDGLIFTCDLRPVVYKNGEPYFEDDGSSVNEYRSECKARKRARAKAMAKAQREKAAVIEREQQEQIAREKAELKKETKKILRRKKVAA